MAPGIFRLRTACFTLVIPVRLAICLPLLIFTLDAYSPHGALFPGPPQGPDISSTVPPHSFPLIINNITHSAPPAPANGNSNLSPEDAHNMLEHAYLALRPVPPPPSAHLGRALTLSFVIAAAALSVLSLIALWWFGASSSVEDDATIVEGDDDSDERAARRLHLAALSLGTATRLLLGALGTTAMARVISERSSIKQGSFVAVEVLGWILVAVLYFGAFHRIHCILWGYGSAGEALQGNGKEVLRVGSPVGRRDESLELVSGKT